MEIKTEYQTVIESLFKRQPSRQSRSSRFFILLEALGHPQFSYPTIHVAGTNGKGQTCVKIAKALEIAGAKVGLFISPHIFTFEERITINGEKIPKKQVIEYDKYLTSLAEKHHLSLHFFEYATCMAFIYFKERKVDVAVIEAGLGGKWDSTNSISPIVSVISSISLDHLDQLGSSINKIAEHKAGIIKPYIPVVLGPTANHPVMIRRAKEIYAPIYPVEKTGPLYDFENRAIAEKALHLLKKDFLLTPHSIEKGLEANLPCRFEKIGNIIFDGAHNPDGFFRLVQSLNYLYPKQTFRFVIGMNLDKDIKGCLRMILSKAHYVHFVQSAVEKSASLESLQKVWQEISIIPFSLELNIQEGVQNANAACKNKEILVICGSFYIMADAFKAIMLEVGR